MGRIFAGAALVPLGLLVVFAILFVLVVDGVGQALDSAFGFGSAGVRAWMLDTPQPRLSDFYGEAGVPGAGPVFSGGQVHVTGYQGAASFRCQLPAERGTLTDRYGSNRAPYPNHSGIDYGTCHRSGVPVITPFGGQVVYAGASPVGYGNLLVIENDGWQVYLAHNSEFLVQVGDQVQAGDTVALSGSTGNSTGPHVHLETRQCTDGRCTPRDPNTVWLPGQREPCDWYALAAACTP